MVAPLIAGVARAVGTGVKAGQRAKRALEHPAGERNRRLGERRARREARPLSAEEAAAQTARAVERLGTARRMRALQNSLGRSRMLRSLAPESSPTEKIWTAVASTFILWSVIPFCVPQVMLWMLGLVGMSSEGIPVANMVLPGQELFILTYAGIVLIGVGSMGYAAVVYTMRGVKCFAGVRMLVFACCLTGYLVFFVNLFPWVLLWILSVILSKGPTEEEKED